MENQSNSSTDADVKGIAKLTAAVSRLWAYVSSDVWRDTRNGWKVNVVKTLNLTVRSFLNSDLQSQACAMTYRTLLAIVPTLALLFAVGRGFGFQNIIQTELFKLFPAQRSALDLAMRFIDSTLAQASEGLFVGIGIAFLLWTLISLLSSVEDSFNRIWNVRQGRSIFRQATDYTAICIILPILMICSGGLQLLVSATIQKLLPAHVFSPVMKVLLDIASYFFAWLFFTGAYMLIPNTKVKFGNAFIAGVLAGTSFQLLQWAFASGQLYVAKYNAIYGTFSFLPLLLLWLQLSWLITLTGALICYSSQNYFRFSFEKEIRTVSLDYRRRVSLSVLTVIVQRFDRGESPLSASEISMQYNIPPQLTDIIVSDMISAGLLGRQLDDSEVTEHPLVPVMSLRHYSVSGVLHALRHVGATDFIPGFSEKFGVIDDISKKVDEAITNSADTVMLKDIPLHTLL